jgi:RNA polymerase sigma-70 factor (ECF subfamily)
MTVPTDELIRRYQAGQTNLFEVLYDRHKEYVYRVAYSLTRHAEEAEEVVQETFLDVLKALPRYRVEGPARFETWLYRVTANRAKMRLRRKQLPTLDWEEVGERLAVTPDAETDHDPEQAVQHGETRRRIWRAVGRLGELSREVILLRYGQGYAYGEIAEALDLSLGTVKSRLSAAHRQLRALLSDDEGLAEEVAGRRRRRRPTPLAFFLVWAFSLP